MTAEQTVDGGCDWLHLLLPAPYSWSERFLSSSASMNRTPQAGLPKEGQRNTQGSFAALAGFVLGSALLTERASCAAVYPLTLLDVAIGSDSSSTWMTFVSHPHLGAGIAADAAGLVDKAENHFDAALEASERVPIRLLRPVTLLWHGRCLIERGQAADRERARAMLSAALDDFRALGIVPYTRLAATALDQAR